jgi:hypothetical protein
METRLQKRIKKQSKLQICSMPTLAIMTPERLKEWRTARGWSVSRAARECGVGSRNSWAAWEKPGGSPPEWLGYVLRAVGDGLPAYK